MITNINRKFIHCNEFYYPNIAGPTKHIEDVINNTFDINDHYVISFDRINNNDNYQYVYDNLIRFWPININDLHNIINYKFSFNTNFSKFVEHVRKINPVCVNIYFKGWLPLIIRYILPEIKIIFMPFGYAEGDYSNIFRSQRFKIALCGDGAKEDYLKAGARPEQIHVIERPINTNFYFPLNVTRDPFRLLLVGRFHPIKRIPALIHTLASLFNDYPSLHLHIVADTNICQYTGAVKDELNAVKAAIQKYKLQEKVILRGRKIGEDLLREYSEASIHILPSTHDRRATVVQEAITMGMQCICTCKKSYDWPEYAEDGRHLIHYVDEVEDIIPVLRKMLDNPDQYHSNRDYALEHWSWEKCAPEYEKLMTEW